AARRALADDGERGLRTAAPAAPPARVAIRSAVAARVRELAVELARQLGRRGSGVVARGDDDPVKAPRRGAACADLPLLPLGPPHARDLLDTAAEADVAGPHVVIGVGPQGGEQGAVAGAAEHGPAPRPGPAPGQARVR